MEKGPRIVSHLPEAHQSWVPGYPWATEHPESLLSWLWEQEEWESRKEKGGSVSREFQSGAEEERQGRSEKTAEHHGTGFESGKPATECLKAAPFFKGGTVREAIGHQAQVTSLGNSGSCIPSQSQGQVAIYTCRGAVREGYFGRAVGFDV